MILGVLPAGVCNKHWTEMMTAHHPVHPGGSALLLGSFSRALTGLLV